MVVCDLRRFLLAFVSFDITEETRLFFLSGFWKEHSVASAYTLLIQVSVR